MGWKGLAAMGRDTKRKLYLRKRHFSVIETYIEEVKQDEKHVPDLLESIMRPTFFVKEELRPISFTNLDPKSQKSRFQLFGSRKSKVFPPEANASLLASKF